MRVLIAYASKSGTTEKCVRRLENELANQDVTVADLTKTTPDTDGYDFVAVGGPIRRGKMHPAVKKFIHHAHDALMKTPCGFFVVCGYTDSSDEYMYKTLPHDLYESAAVTMTFGGELNVKAQKGIDRLMMKMLVSSILDDGYNDGETKETSLPGILPDNISRFAGEIKRSFAKTKSGN